MPKPKRATSLCFSHNQLLTLELNREQYNTSEAWYASQLLMASSNLDRIEFDVELGRMAASAFLKSTLK